jgi:hypothetical protein
MERIIVSNWKGSELTADRVRKQIIDRWGQEEAGNYDPKSNCLTFNQWLENGYRVKKGEKAIKSVTVIEKKNEKGEVIQKFAKMVNLFYLRQVEKIA